MTLLLEIKCSASFHKFILFFFRRNSTSLWRVYKMQIWVVSNYQVPYHRWINIHVLLVICGGSLWMHKNHNIKILRKYFRTFWWVLGMNSKFTSHYSYWSTLAEFIKIYRLLISYLFLHLLSGRVASIRLIEEQIVTFFCFSTSRTKWVDVLIFVFLGQRTIFGQWKMTETKNFRITSEFYQSIEWA